MVNLIRSLSTALLGGTKIDMGILTDAIADLKTAIIALVMVAFLLSAALLILCYIAFEYFVQQGLTELVSAAMIAAFLAMLAIINYLWAEKRLSRLRRLQEAIQTESAAKYLPEAEQLLSAFMEGYSKQPADGNLNQSCKNRADFV
jgi:uncharacterized membrane protein YbhN (UPF0104 family)